MGRRDRAFSGDRRAATEALHDLLLDATAARMTADVPVGASRRRCGFPAVVALMQAAQPSTKVRTFTVALPDIVLDESAAAAPWPTTLGTEHTTVELTAGEAMATITEPPRLRRTVRRPVADPGRCPAHGPRAHDRRRHGRRRGRGVRGYNRYVLGSAAWLRPRRRRDRSVAGSGAALLTVSPRRVDALMRRIEPVKPGRPDSATWATRCRS